MKRLIIILVLLFIAPNAHAGLITVKTLSSDASINDVNSNFNVIKNEINESLDDANVEDASLTESEMANDINPRVRMNELFNDITISGHLPATSASTLTSDISAGTSYVSGFRTNTAATSHTYTASKDTWVYIDINSTFQFEEVANDAVQPTAPSNSLLLAKVVTDADNITSVTDHRTTSLSVSSPEDFTIKGYYVLSSDNEAVSVDPGVTYVGSTRVVKTAITALRVGTATDWHDGVADAAATAWWYIGAKSTGDIKWLGANPPNIHDTSENTNGNLYYYDDGTNHWRIIGVIRMNSAGHIDHMVQSGDTYTHGLPPSLTTTISTTWKKLDCSAGMPQIAKRGKFGLYSNDTANSPAGIWIKPLGSAWGTAFADGIYIDTAASPPKIAGQRWCPTNISSDTDQVIEYINDVGDDNTEIRAEGFVSYIRD